MENDQQNGFERTKLVYQRGTERVLIFSSFILLFSIVLIGWMVYSFTEEEVVKKLKEKELVYIGESMSSKIDEQILRAKETALLFANDPAIYDWVVSGEERIELEGYAMERLHQLVDQFEYSNSFIVSGITNHYWSETGTIIETMSEENPLNAWFYQTLSSGEKVSVNFDYNAGRNDTFVFINALMGEIGSPIAVVGVGFSLESLSNDLMNYKYVDNSNLWLIDKEGMIYLSDRSIHNGTNIEQYIPAAAKTNIIDTFQDSSSFVMEYNNDNQETMDLISYPISSKDWKLIYQIPRNETVTYLDKIKYNSVIVIVIYFLSILFFFYYVSRKLANPYKLALKVNEQLQETVEVRTRELVEKNAKLADSIDYAKRIQETILPRRELFTDIFDEHFLIWEPKDKVGGDFYWLKEVNGGYLFAIGDCTGHGIPGALMTMLTISNLNHIVENEKEINPGSILSRLNNNIKHILKQDSKEGLTDDGLDIGLIYFQLNQTITFAGAKCSLYIKNYKDLNIIKGDRKSIGYRRTDLEFPYKNTVVNLQPNDVIYMTTDGYIDQNGEKNASSFGRNNFLQLIETNYEKPIEVQKNIFVSAIQSYMGNEAQRDDITLFACRFKTLKSN